MEAFPILYVEVCHSETLLPFMQLPVAVCHYFALSYPHPFVLCGQPTLTLKRLAHNQLPYDLFICGKGGGQ
jgi:hypothetical protein